MTMIQLINVNLDIKPKEILIPYHELRRTL